MAVAGKLRTATKRLTSAVGSSEQEVDTLQREVIAYSKEKEIGLDLIEEIGANWNNASEVTRLNRASETHWKKECAAKEKVRTALKRVSGGKKILRTVVEEVEKILSDRSTIAKLKDLTNPSKVRDATKLVQDTRDFITYLSEVERSPGMKEFA
jgi:hypothetical protein